MQGGRSILDSLPDTIDLNQGSVSGVNNNAMNNSSAWDNLVDNIMLSSVETSVGCTNTSWGNARRFSGWDAGESSSGKPDHMHTDLKIAQGWSTAVSTCATPDAMQEDHPQQSHDLRSDSGNGYSGNHVNRRAINMPNPSPNHYSRNVDLNCDYMGNGHHSWQGTTSRCYFPNRAETHEGLTIGSSTKNLGASSSNSRHMMENSDESGSSFGAFEPSGKRKAFEGSPAQLYPGGSSSTHAQAENSAWNNCLARFDTTESFTASPPVCWPHYTDPEHMDPRIAVGLRGSSDILPSRTAGDMENAARNVGGRLDVCHQGQDMFSFPSTDAALGSSSNQPSRSFASSESSIMPMDSPYHANQSRAMHVPGYSGSMLPYPWNGSLDSQSGSSLHPFMLSPDNGAVFQDEQNSRNNMHLPAAVTSLERRPLVQDSPSSNLALGNSQSSRSLIPSSRTPAGSSIRNPPPNFTADQNSIAHNHHGLTEYAPWALFPPVELDHGNQRGHSPITPPESSLEAEMLSFSSRRRQLHGSRAGLVIDAPSDSISSWRALAVDLEGRHRLIRQVRNAVRRRDNWRAQDFAVFGPFINGAAELHDRHSDMRLDVDSMSYEELLALEERMGNVSTGLNEEIIMKSMNQQKYQPTGSSSNDEPCCICREEYASGDDIAAVACGHEFHTECIKQWLLLKNICPICKMTALET